MDGLVSRYSVSGIGIGGVGCIIGGVGLVSNGVVICCGGVGSSGGLVLFRSYCNCGIGFFIGGVGWWVECFDFFGVSSGVGSWF